MHFYNLKIFNTFNSECPLKDTVQQGLWSCQHRLSLLDHEKYRGSNESVESEITL